MKLYAKSILLAMSSAFLVSSAVHAQAPPASIVESADRGIGSLDYQEAVKAYLDKTVKKIINGKPAGIGQLPWQVSLGVAWIADPSDAHFCGGTVYNESWIVTAAHCVDGNAPQSIIVTSGTNDLKAHGQRRNVSRVLVKDGYVDADKGNDVALLELFEPLLLDKNTKPVALLQLKDATAVLLPGASLTTSGFGYTKEGGEVSATLNYVDIPFVTTEECNAPLSYDGAITDDMICAGLTDGGKDSCQGDSGGPLIANASTSPVLAGIVSWGEGCARPLKFGIYTKVTQFSDWINTCIGDVAQCTTK